MHRDGGKEVDSRNVSLRESARGGVNWGIAQCFCLHFFLIYLNSSDSSEYNRTHTQVQDTHACTCTQAHTHVCTHVHMHIQVQINYTKIIHTYVHMYTYDPTFHQSAYPPSFPILPIIRGHTVSTATSGHVLHRAANARLLSFLTLSSPSCRAKSVNLRPQRTIWEGEEKPLKSLKTAHRLQPQKIQHNSQKCLAFTNIHSPCMQVWHILDWASICQTIRLKY